jgi:hypothetical protein
MPFDASTLERPTMNEFASLGKYVHLAVRQLRRTGELRDSGPTGHYIY